MSKALRLSEKWFRRGLWLVAVVFASFLIGLGGTIVGDLPKVERPLQVDDFLDKAQARALRDTIRAQRDAEQDEDEPQHLRLRRGVSAAEQIRHPDLPDRGHERQQRARDHADGGNDVEERGHAPSSSSSMSSNPRM